MRLLALALAALATAGAAAAAPGSALRIEYRAQGSAGPVARYSLVCGARAAATPGFRGSPRACARLAVAKGVLGAADPFAPLPSGIACSEIYGGPQQARVRGTFRGRKIDATFSRTDGCQVARWNAVAFLFPPLPAGGAADSPE